MYCASNLGGNGERGSILGAQPPVFLHTPPFGDRVVYAQGVILQS